MAPPATRRGASPAPRAVLRATLLLLVTLLPSAATAQDFSLALPLDCTLGETCFIQQYVDADPGPGFRDFTGGRLSYDGHKGTDFRLPDLEAMEGGVPVLASAPGTVRGIRDGMEDRIVADRAEVAGRECGNGVAIDHGNGWATQLCHLAQGSVRVAEGDRVEAGDILGEVGLSGATQFPHVHIAVRRNGVTVDPFVEDLWADPPTYEPGGLLSAGLMDAVPDFDAVKAGTADVETLGVDAPALVVWGSMFGSRVGDVLCLSIQAPDGTEIFASDATIDRDQAQSFRAAGRRTPPEGWSDGRYTGNVAMIRDGAEIDRLTTTVTLR